MSIGNSKKNKPNKQFKELEEFKKYIFIVQVRRRFTLGLNLLSRLILNYTPIKMEPCRRKKPK